MGKKHKKISGLGGVHRNINCQEFCNPYGVFYHVGEKIYCRRLALYGDSMGITQIMRKDAPAEDILRERNI